MVTLHENVKISKSSDILIRKLPFQRLGCEIFQSVPAGSDKLFTSVMLLALQEAAEYYLVGLFEKTNLHAVHTTHVISKLRDIQLPKCICTDRI